MKRILVAGLMVALAGCSTPQDRCIGSVTRDLRVVDRLIAEAEGNLARGYAYETVVVRQPTFIDCTASVQHGMTSLSGKLAGSPRCSELSNTVPSISVPV